MLGPEQESDGRYCARFVFPTDFIGFQGHFPGNPVLPGICKIQAVMAMCRAVRNEPVILSEVITAKFIAPVTCNQALTVECRETAVDGGNNRITAWFRRDGKPVARIDILVNGGSSGSSE